MFGALTLAVDGLFLLKILLFSRCHNPRHCWSLGACAHGTVSIFAHAELDDIVVEIVFLGQLEKVLPRFLPQGQVHRVGVEPHLHYFLLLIEFYVA